jgi:PAS domain S-box-containing protein
MKKNHVLIVEDHEENRNLLKLLLEVNGYKVSAAANGVEALDAAHGDPPDVVVSDALMPKMDGFALCRAWSQDDKLKSIPFIFYSSTYVRPDDEKLGMALGAVRYLIKPLEAKVFLAELRATLQQWAGQTAPAPEQPLDDATAHAMHESALARKVEDKMAQLEAANRKLRESEERYQRIYESVQDVYLEARLDATIVEISPQIVALSRGQFRREDVIGTSAHKLFADTQFADAVLNAVRQHGRVADAELTFRNRDGSHIPCSISATAVRGADGVPRVVATLRDMTRRKRAEEQIRSYVAQLEKMHDPYTAGHQRRVAEVAAAVGAEMGLDARRLEGLRVAGYLHDIGNIRVPAEIMSKPGKLTPEEWRLVQAHSQAGSDVLQGVEFPWPVATVVLQHHERLDGSGYPQGLKGDAIALEARILAVADVVVAMSSRRPYADAVGIEEVLAEIERGSGKVYDAEVARACLRLFREKGHRFPA